MTTVNVTITSDDLRNAADIAANSYPCAQALKEEYSGARGEGTAYCIMGCVVKAVAQRTKRSFESVAERIAGDEGGVLSEGLANALELSYDPLINNDIKIEEYSRFDFTDESDLREWKKNMEKGRKWQVETLLKMADKMDNRQDGSVKVELIF